MTYYATNMNGTNGHGAGAPATTGANGDNWQAVYTYAQQLYDAGHVQQAEEYHAYAQQLYDAEQQRLSQIPPPPKPSKQTVSLTPVKYESSAPPSPPRPSAPAAPSASTPAASSAPAAPAMQIKSGQENESWAVLYNYAQELYAAGDTRQAEEYYNQAQVLYAKANPQANAVQPQNTTAAASWSANTDMQATDTQSNDNNSWGASSSTANDGSLAPAPAVAAPAMETMVISRDSIAPEPQKKRKPCKKKNWKLRIWVTVLLLVTTSLGAYIAMFHVYKKQLTKSEEDAVYYDATWSKVQDWTIRPVIRFLTPAFDKTLRLSTAAQPLLYELHLRSTPPKNIESSSTEPDVQAAGMLPEQSSPQPTDAAAENQSETASEETQSNDTESATTDEEASESTTTDTDAATEDDASPSTSTEDSPSPSSDDVSTASAPAPAAENAPEAQETKSKRTKRKRRSKRRSKKKTSSLSTDPMKGMSL